MLLYDIPLIKSSLSTKCLGGLFTRTKYHEPTEVKTQQWLPKTYWQVIVAKTTSFELYRYKRSSKYFLQLNERQQKIHMQFVTSTDVYGEICNIETCTVKISESKEYLDIIIVTLNTGELLVYYYSRDEKKFTCSFRDIIFKQKYQNINFQNPRNVGNYIVCSQQNHFMISSVRCFKKLYQVQATQYEEKIKVSIKAQDIHVKENHVCWNLVWLPSMSNQNEYLGKYVAIQKAVVTLESQPSNRQYMVDQREEQRQILPQKKLRYYYVERNLKISERQEKKQGYRNLNETAHMLIPLSSSSFFIMYENRLRLRELPNETAKQQPKEELIDVEFPLREALVDKNIKCMFSAYSRQVLDDKKNVFHLVNEFGDLFRVQYTLTGTFVANFSLKYLNSVKTVHSIVYVGEIANSQIQLGDKDSESFNFKVKHQNATLILLGLERFSISLYFLLPQPTETKPKETRVSVRPVGKPKTSRTYPEYSDKISFKPIAQRSRDLQISDQIEHMGVIIDTKVANLRGNTQKDEGKGHQQNFQIFALTNSGNLRHQEHIDQTIDNIQIHKSHMKIIKKGLKIKQINSLQSAKLHQIYCFKKSQKQSNHKIVILCTNGKTYTYTIANDMFMNNKQLAIEENATSVYIGKLQDESYVQIIGSRIRHIRKEKNGVKEIPIKNKIVLATCAGRQLFVALYGGQVIFCELDKEKDSVQLRKQFYVNDQVVSMQLTPLENNKIDQNTNKRASRFLIISTKNYEIIIYRINFKSEKETTFDQIYTENVKSPIQSVASIIVTSTDQNGSNGERMYHVFLGMENGSVIKMEFDRTMKKVTQKISNVGSKPVKLKRCSIGSRREDSLLITTDKTFVYYNHNGKYKMHLIACSNIDLATQMRQAENPNTIITFGERNPPHKDLVRILSIESFGEDFHDERVDLFFSGKKLLVFENNVGIIEADPSYEKMKKRRVENDIDVESNFIQIENLQKTWKSQFTIYKVKDAKKIAAIYFDQTKEICICAAYNSIKSGPNAGNYLIFGCAEGITYYPKMQAKQQTIKIYSWIVERKMNEKQNEYKTQFLYSLNIDAIPLVIEPFFKGEKFLIGIGKTLRMYEIGKKKLLLKAETKNLPSNVNQIKTIGKKIYITSVADSFHLFKYIPEEKTFYDIAEDQLPKYITAMNILDADTVCAADKFGNLFIGRLTENAKTEFENASGSSKALESGHLCKFNTLAKINVGQIVTSIHKVSLYTSKAQVIIYSTVMGQIRVLYPLTEYEEVKVFPLLEEKIKEKYKVKEINGNNWGATQNVIMGEYVEKFLSMSENDQKEILRGTEIIEEIYVDYVKDMIEGVRSKII